MSVNLRFDRRSPQDQETALLPAGVRAFKGDVLDPEAMRGFLRGVNALFILNPLVDGATDMGCSPSQLAIAWLIRRSPRVIPLIGARKPEQLADSLDAAGLTVPNEIMDRLDEATTIDLGFPHDFLRANRMAWYGAAAAALDPRMALLRERITDLRSAWTTISPFD